MYQRPNQFWIIWSVISLYRLKNSFFILFGAFMIKAEMCELLLSLLKVFWSIKVGHKQHLCEIMKPWCGRDFAASKLSNLRILIKYKLLSERQIYTKFSWSSCCASLTFENCKTSCMVLYLCAESKNILSQTFNFAKKFLSIFLPSYDPKKNQFSPNKWHFEISAFTWPRIQNWCSASTTTALSRRMHCWETAGIEPHFDIISTFLILKRLQVKNLILLKFLHFWSQKACYNLKTLAAWTCIPCWRRTVVVAKTKSLPLIWPVRITRTGTGTNTDQIQMKTPIQIKITKSQIQT